MLHAFRTRLYYQTFTCRRGIRTSSSLNSNKVIFSGIQPTGNLHLGNYLGAVRHWIDLQYDQQASKTFFCIVDLHAITVPRDPQDLKDSIYTLTAELLGAGLDPQRCTLYCQSSVQEHAEMGWILGTLANHNKLRNLPNFKSKAQKDETEPYQLGLLIYPVLQAADILLFHATHVPVGVDQVAHLNLTNSLREDFNRVFKDDYFAPVQPLIGDLPKVKSLTQPTKKMSKSDEEERSRINIIDTPDLIREKIKKCMTDSVRANTYDPESRPGVSNLIDLYSICGDVDKETAIAECAGMKGKVQLKEVVAESIVERLRPIRERSLDFLKNKDYIDQVLDRGAEEARVVATKTMGDVRNFVGFRKR